MSRERIRRGCQMLMCRESESGAEIIKLISCRRVERQVKCCQAREGREGEPRASRFCSSLSRQIAGAQSEHHQPSASAQQQWNHYNIPIRLLCSSLRSKRAHLPDPSRALDAPPRATSQCSRAEAVHTAKGLCLTGPETKPIARLLLLKPSPFAALPFIPLACRRPPAASIVFIL